MSWNVRVKITAMKGRYGEETRQVVFDEYVDELKDICERGGGFSDNYVGDIDVDEDVRKIYEVEHKNEYGEKWVDTDWRYYTPAEIQIALNKARDDMIRFLHKKEKIENFVNSKEYWALSPEEKENVDETAGYAKEEYEEAAMAYENWAVVMGYVFPWSYQKPIIGILAQ